MTEDKLLSHLEIDGQHCQDSLMYTGKESLADCITGIRAKFAHSDTS